LPFEGSFQREVIHRLAVAVSNSLTKAQPVTHIGLGQAEVFKVASNRRHYMYILPEPVAILVLENTTMGHMKTGDYWLNASPMA
jgi:hypothetical protein